MASPLWQAKTNFPSSASVQSSHLRIGFGGFLRRMRSPYWKMQAEWSGMEEEGPKGPTYLPSRTLISARGHFWECCAFRISRHIRHAIHIKFVISFSGCYFKSQSLRLTIIRMPHRKRSETKRQPNTAKLGHQIKCCLVPSLIKSRLWSLCSSY